MDKIVVEFLKSGCGALGAIGNIQNILCGNFPDHLCLNYFQSKEYACGFGYGSPKDLDSIGESILVNGTCYTQSTDPDSELYNKLIHGQEFLTSNYFLVSQGSAPTFSAKGSDVQLEIEALFKMLVNAIKTPIAISGLVTFETLRGSCMGKAPIHKKLIFENKSEYFPFSEIHKNKTCAFIMGVVSDPSESSWEIINKKLQTVTCKSPLEDTPSLLQHIHVLILDGPCKSEESISSSITAQCIHLALKGSVILNLNLNIFPIKDIKDFESHLI
ncbi:MAG: hypothetical protein EBZ47_06585 [Chlamydiae bacterium]|nr:hypothetical protein [Chlamydiota bacterium]